MGVRFQAGGPAQYAQACKLSRKLFLFLSCIWDLVGYNYSNQRRNNMSEASEELKRIAAALEEILRLVKLDQEKYQKLNEKK